MDQALLERFQQAYKDLDLFPLVEPETIEQFRVDYGLPVMVRLKREIEASVKNGKFIFAGHRGCGKSTLLKRLAIDMQPNHSVVFFSIADLIEMSGITHVNILYAIAIKLLSQASKQRIPVAEDIKQSLLGWNTTERTQISSQATTGELGLGLDNILNMFTAKLQQEKSFRDELEKTFEKRISDLVGKCDRLAAAIQTATKKPVLVIIDDLDKLDLPLVEEIYRNNIKSLFSPQFQVVFTIPVSAVQEPQVMGALNSEGVVRPHLFPVAKFFAKADCHNPEAEPVAKTFDVFLKVLAKRLPDELVDAQTARKMVLKSGGVMRELVRIARECCTECMVQLEIEPDSSNVNIDDEILTAALRNLRHDFARQIGSDLYDLLVEVYKTAETPDASSDGFVKLLHGLMVLEYENDALWYDVHPIVVDLLKQKKLIE
ncbi:P-loop NTPase fold protein [Leptolyngbya sp. CCNP1308]|uniref:P-loop NTPase fold protein n=1 Tax=Leptolyngbya sp. CCNP1308 TaxID=3110255 RepID=UPI002B21FB06|nr:P-loop NTPase fold protein [Leptolyngbya sp. CCNP1308]MEA5448859.1 P-loop NTPase fold protein [Leptolyngbya sp. CCNP1308]